MSDKRIVCTEQSPTAAGHGHIVAVGIGLNPSQASAREDVRTVRFGIYMRRDRYYTMSPDGKKIAWVQNYTCSCGVETIRSDPDATVDNNLDNLRMCHWPAPKSR